MIDDDTIHKTAESAYDTMLELFEHPEPSQAWVDEFNAAAAIMEHRCDDGVDDGLPTTNHVLPWIAWLEDDRPYIASPPIILKGASIRLTLDVLRPLNGIHINVHAIPCNSRGEMLDKMSNANTACLIIDADAGPAMIFAGWDFVAREGIEEALKAGAIVKSWEQVVTSKVPCMDLGSIEEQHAAKMLEVYAADKDLDRAIVEYRKVCAGKSYRSNSLAVKYNKIRFHLGMTDAKYETLESEQVRINRENMTPKQYARWLLNGVQLTYQMIQQAFVEAENEVYKDRKLIALARDTRNMKKRCIINSRAPGDGIPVALVPEDFAFTEFVPLIPDESTNRTNAIRAALVKLGRKDSFDGVKFRDVTGVLSSELKYGMDLTGSSVYTKFRGVLVDKSRAKAVKYEYKTCLKNY